MPAYRQTEVGLIPDEWHVSRFGDLCSVLRGGSPRPIQNYITDRADGINWIKIGDVGVGAKFIDATAERIIPSGALRSRYVKAGDFLLSNSMSFGRPYILRTEGCIHDGWLVIQGYHGSFDTGYLHYCLSGEAVLTQYTRYAAGSSVLNLNKEVVSGISIAVPPLPEQRAIAEALSDVDGLLGALEALIAKKRAIKQAAMQQLLTGKTRLPGFRREWAEINMAADSILKARIGWQGLTTSEYLSTGEYFLVTGTDFMNGSVDWSTCHFVSRDRFVQDRNIQLNPGDVLLTKDGTIGKAGYVETLPGPATLNSGVFVIRPKNDAYIPLYMYYVLTSRIFDEFLARLQAGSTITHLYQKDFVGFAFDAPPRDEQIAIATVLSDMDAEVAALEARRDKTRAVKQGMMQQLLTGRVRLVKPEAAA